jgi:oligopeptide transport system substrate-binding protein
MLMNLSRSSFILSALVLLAGCISAGCTASANNQVFFGKTDPPRLNVLRYVSGPEPETLDPQISDGQPEARIYMALYEGLVEYDPKTTQPIAALAERWEINHDSSEFTFHLRHDGRFSNGDPITARDFVYTIRRGLSPKLGSRTAALAYYIKYARAYNESDVFVADPNTGAFLLEKDFKEEPANSTQTKPREPLTSHPIESVAAEYPPIPEDKTPDADTAFHHFIHSPDRLTIPADEKARAKFLDANPKVKAAVAGKQFIPVKPDDVGVEAVDDYTLRISLSQPAPFFLSMMPHQFFRVINQKAIEKFGDAWTREGNIVTSGPFTLESWKDYMDAPEAGIEYYQFNCKRPPTNDVRVRKALNMSVDKNALGAWRHQKALTAITPDGMFPGYPQPKGDQFDPDSAKKLLTAAGYRDASGKYDSSKFPVAQIEIDVNTGGSNLLIAEFIQEQWKQNLGVTIPIKPMEPKTFLDARAKLDYKGIARNGWGADYMDPFTFLGLYYTGSSNNGTGWFDPKYAELLDEANSTSDGQKRYDLMAQAEAIALDAQPVMPLLTTSARWMKKPYIKGMYPNPGSLFPWKFVYIERDNARWDYGVPSTQ